MEKSNRLTAKDLINVGIYTAIYLVVVFLVGMFNAIPFLYPVIYFVAPLLAGVPLMLFLTKVKKFGMVLIMSVICGIFWFLVGYTWIPIVSYLIAGILTELVLKMAKYKNFKLLAIGYWVFSLGLIGCQMPMWVMTDSYMGYVRNSMGVQYAEQLAYYMPWWIGLVGIGLIFAGAMLGARLGRKMLKKHFERAGIV